MDLTKDLMDYVFSTDTKEEIQKNHIYVLWDYENMPNIDETRVKIGISTNPEKRTSAIITQSGLLYGMYLTSFRLINYDNTETEIHKKLKQYRTNGEWFKINPFKAIEEILAIENKFDLIYINPKVEELHMSLSLGIDLKNLGKNS